VKASGLTFPLVPRHRLVGLPFGEMRGARRGVGSDVAATRPYRSGDDVRAVHWAASARLSSAHGTDEFVVRERFADEAPLVVIVCDRRPAMTLFPPELPWLQKHEAVRIAARIIAESAAHARGFIGYLDFALGSAEPFWRRPQSQSEVWHISERHLAFPAFRAPDDTVAQALAFLADHRRSVPPGSFIFVLSDFLSPPSREQWERALEHRWDVVPVVIQDPVWEQSFPAVESITLRLADASGRARLVRLSRAETEARRAEHEARRERLWRDFEAVGIDPILVSSAEPEEVFRGFLAWSDERQFRRGRLG
jgi:uncharacterized protein (DUF58 family)